MTDALTPPSAGNRRLWPTAALGMVLLAVLTALLIGLFRLPTLLLPDPASTVPTDLRLHAPVIGDEPRVAMPRSTWRFPPMDDDGYYFLRLSEQLLTTGSPCMDADRSTCRDTLANAPIGREIDRAWSPHVLAIAATHAVVTNWRADVPMWVSAGIMGWLLGLVLIVPLILLLPRSGGWPCIGALVAVIALTTPVVAIRTVAADNDIWMAVLPLAVLIALTAALDRLQRSRLISLGLVAGALLGLLALVWSGWFLFFAIFACGLAAAGALEALSQRHWTGLIPAALISAFVISVVVLLALLPATPDLPVGEILSIGPDVFQRLFGGASPTPAEPPLWPNAFDYVMELIPTTPELMIVFFGPLALSLGFSGPILAVLPSGRAWLARWALVPLAWLMLAYFPPPSLTLLGAGFFLLFALAAAVGAATRASSMGRPGPHPLWTLTAVWLAAVVMLSESGLRFLFLAAAPLALGIGATLLTAVDDWRRQVRPFNPHIIAASLALALFLSLLPGHFSTLRAYAIPIMNSAWDEVLADLGRTEATVVSWWDWGHRTTYFSGRPVVSDGAGLQNPVLHWIGYALVNPNPERAAALLHQTACGVVDSTEGPLRTHDFLLRSGVDPRAAIDLIQQLVIDSPLAAETTLRRAGLAPESAARAAAALSCRHPDLVLLTSSLMLHNQALIDSGMWRHPSSGHDRSVELWSTGWHRCSEAAAGYMDCPLGLLGRDTTLLTRLRYDPAQAFNLLIDAVDLQTGQDLSLRPQVVRVAAGDGLSDGALHGDVVENLAVLVDKLEQRVYIGTVATVRSLLIRLILLDGRYDQDRFQPLSQATSLDGERVTAWRVLPQPSSAATEQARSSGSNAP